MERIRIKLNLEGKIVVKMVKEKRVKDKGVSRYRVLHSAECGQSPTKSGCQKLE